ncbi:MAG: hypothetical protein ACRENU_13820 [Gemmatimonadaceae bacterium]
MRPSLQLVVFAALSVAVTSAAVAQHHHDPRADSIVGVAKQAMGTLRDSVSLRQAGWSALGFGAGVRDLSPFQGQHWIMMPRFVANLATDLSQPSFLMYLPLGDSLVPIGVAYTRRMPIDASVPDSLAGGVAEWHTHMFCRNVPGQGNILSDGVEDCAMRGGNAAPLKIAMVHTWTVPNPDGPYAHDNPALPFLATGLRAPQSATREDREFAIALGETYGARLFIVYRIERDIRRKPAPPEGLAKLEALRVQLRELVPQLRDAERTGDRKKFDALRKQMVNGYTSIAELYRGLAQTPEIRARYDYELTQALERKHKHM